MVAMSRRREPWRLNDYDAYNLAKMVGETRSRDLPDGWASTVNI
jgi:hypothetical protein